MNGGDGGPAAMFASVGDELLAEIPVREFDVPDIDLDDLPPDLQQLLARDSSGSLAPDGSHAGSLSIPSDIQSILTLSRAASSRGSNATGGTAGASPSPALEWKVNFDVLRRSNTLAAGLPLAVQRSARKLEKEAPVVRRLTRASTPMPPSRQGCSMSASGLIAIASRALAGSPDSTGRSFCNGHDSKLSTGTEGVTLPADPAVVVPTAVPSMMDSTDFEIEQMLKGTIQNDDVEQFLRPTPHPDIEAASSSADCTYAVGPPRGLMNLGNTCFLNAAVQALGHCAPFAAYMLQGLFVPDLNQANPLGTGCVLTMVFGALLHELFALRSASPSDASASQSFCSESSNSQAFPPLDFLLAVAQFHPFLASGEMHDAQELLTWLLDALHEDLNRVRRSGRTPVRVCVDTAKLAELGQERFAAEAWRNHLLRNRSVIVDLFQGQLRSQLRCPECGLVSVTFDPFLHLTLPLPADREAVRLEDAVQHFCREEALDGQNVWECPGCQRKVQAVKKLDLWKLPHVLCVNLKRFEWLEVGPQAYEVWGSPYVVRKLSCAVDFVEEGLDFGPFVAAEAPQKEPLVYDLTAVVDHLGDSADTGHYTSTCRRPEGWYHFDDSTVTPLPHGIRPVCPHNYVLVFERVGTPREPTAIAEQRASAPHAWPHVINIDWSFLTGSGDSEA